MQSRLGRATAEFLLKPQGPTKGCLFSYVSELQDITPLMMLAKLLKTDC